MKNHKHKIKAIAVRKPKRKYAVSVTGRAPRGLEYVKPGIRLAISSV